MEQFITIAATFFIFISPVIDAQTPISLENAYKKALENNLDLKTGKLHIDYQDRIKGSYAVIDPLRISGEVGQISSAYTDNKFSVEQTLRMPGFYKSQQKVLAAQQKNAVLSLEVQKWQLKREIALLYNELNYQSEKEKLLLKADSLYVNYYRRAALRLKKGESNILEKTTAENYRSQARIQLENLKKDREISLYQFNYLLNDEVAYDIQPSGFYHSFPDESQFSGCGSIPLQHLEEQKNIEKAKLNAEKSKLLPTISLTYNNASMFGNGADNHFYGRSARFHSGMIGVGIPFFNGAQKSVMEGQKIIILIAENNYEVAYKILKNQYQVSFSAFEKLKNETDYYKTEGLKNAETILKTADRLYSEGEINYLEWSILVSQSLDIQNRFIDAQKALNEKVIELNHLTDSSLKTN
ncbi:TolC family protein [Kaistella palustris]|uniref:TolC family protein n=1 Tax=Kaistella palustris TaxID=493376 RepID=UPI000421A8F0|nr:TolC family protein [Kaistella palustris]